MPAVAEDDIMKQIINTPAVESWNIFGQERHNPIKDAAVQGGRAIEIRVDETKNAWDAGAMAPIVKAIKKGDHLVCAVWLKTPEAAKVGLHLQLASDPYTGIGDLKEIALTTSWALYSVEVVADQDYAASATSASLMLAYAKQTIDVGPVFVLDKEQAGR